MRQQIRSKLVKPRHLPAAQGRVLPVPLRQQIFSKLVSRAICLSATGRLCCRPASVAGQSDRAAGQGSDLP
jgi:hypothetical protein